MIGRRSLNLLIIVRLARYRWRQLLILAVLGFILTSAVTGLAALRTSSSAALEASVTGELAGRPYAIQGADRAAVRSLATVKGLAGVRDEQAAASAPQRQVPVLLRTAREVGLPLGTLLEGRRALTPSEATISEATAATLGVSLGDAVTVALDERTTGPIRVVGLTVNPADVDDKLLVTVDPALPADEVTVWLSERDPYTITSLQPLLDSRALTYQSVDELKKVAVRSQPQALSALTYVPAGLAALLIVLIAGTLAALFPTARADAESLSLAGMAPRRAWQKLMGVAFGSVILGELAGVACATAVLAVFKEPVSRTFGQRWLEIGIPWITILSLIAVSGVLAAFSRPVSLGTARLFRWLSIRSVSKFRTTHIAAAAALVGTAIMAVATAARFQTPPAHPSTWAPIGAVLIAAALPVLIMPAMHRKLGRATTVVARHFNISLTIVSTVVIVIAVLTGGFAARATHNAVVNERQSGAPQPPGSYLITEIPNDAAAALAKIYTETGGHRLRQYDLPDEQTARLRVTGTRLVQCMSKAGTLNPDQQPSECYPQKTYSPINTIALSRGSMKDAFADPGLVAKDRVGLLVFAGEAAEAVSIADTSAKPDATLGGNMPGLIVPPDGPVARRFTLTPSGASMVALLDFDSLSERGQARIRAAVNRLAPGAQTADGTQPGAYDNERSLAGAVALAGTALLLLVLLFGGAAVLVAHRRALRTLIDVGAPFHLRRQLALRWVAAPSLALLLAVPLTIGTTAIAGLNAPGSAGLLWLTPFIGGLAGYAVLMVLFVRVPPRVGE